MEYKLLSVDPADTETPGSVKVSPDTKLFFNFRKTFYVEKDTEDWRMLRDIVFNSADKTVILYEAILFHKYVNYF